MPRARRKGGLLEVVARLVDLVVPGVHHPGRLDLDPLKKGEGLRCRAAGCTAPKDVPAPNAMKLYIEVMDKELVADKIKSASRQGFVGRCKRSLLMRLFRFKT